MLTGSGRPGSGDAMSTSPPEGGKAQRIAFASSCLRRNLISAGLRICKHCRTGLASLGFDDALLDIVARDAIDDAAINNSPRLPTLAEARAIIAAAR